MRFSSLSALALVVVALGGGLFVACSSEDPKGENLVVDSGVDSTTEAGDDAATETGFELDSMVPEDTGTADVEPEAPPACGNGIVEDGELCDDGNTTPADGCPTDCKSIESNFVCPTPGKPCVSTVKCGDGKVTGGETCDDSNAVAGDGCDASCKIEPGWICVTVGATCSPAKCGDGLRVGTEACDDGNTANGDGCTDKCQLEPGYKCPTPGTKCTTTKCGDGVTEGTEQCDDGNNDLGDGCYVDCTKEPICTTAGCTSSCGDGLVLGAEECDDGNTVNGDGCSSTCKKEPGFTCTVPTGTPPASINLPIILRDFKTTHPDMELGSYTAAERNLVLGTLGTDGKPVFNTARSPAATSINSATTFNQWYRDVATVNQTFVQPLKLDRQTDGSYRFYSSNFFPLTGLGWGNEGNATNFHFTSEVRYWFQYGGGEVLDFCGDDDVWVFVNKKLALDLGGLHGEECGTVNVDSLGLTSGKVYEIVVWQAERHTTQSNYKLTLRGFFKQKSVCVSKCGDGVKTPDEACDDGKNDGSYGSCTPDCKRAAYCGDSTVQTPPEDCDDGVNLSTYGGCAPGCKKAPYCGDGKVDGAFGELCDDGVLDGSYGGCTKTCKLGPRCGDGVVQADKGETCDDGNTTNGDGCSAVCRKEGPK